MSNLISIAILAALGSYGIGQIATQAQLKALYQEQKAGNCALVELFKQEAQQADPDKTFTLTDQDIQKRFPSIDHEFCKQPRPTR
jgi:hypothetical protein